MRIVLFSHYFPPEVNAPASRAFDHCRRWVRDGQAVTVITSAPNCPDGVLYAGYRNPIWGTRENVEGIEVRRVWTFLAANAGAVKRILNFLSYWVSAFWVGLFVRRPDVIIATSPQFFCAWAGLLVAKFRRVPFVLEIRDIWPESISAVGAMKPGLPLRILAWMERALYHWADHIVTVGQGYKTKIEQRSRKKPRITVITNGVDLELFRPQAPTPGLREKWGPPAQFICSYIGTIGMAHGLNVVLETAVRLKSLGRNDIGFWMIGDGAERQKLQTRARELGVDDRVLFLGRRPKAEMPMFLATTDVCLVHLRDLPLFQGVVPSKIFEIMALRTPMILAVPGEARSIVEESSAGFFIEPENPVELADALVGLREHPERLRELGASGASVVAQKYNRDVLARRYLELLFKVAREVSHRTPVSVSAAGEPAVASAPGVAVSR